MSIPLKINNKHLYQIMLTASEISEIVRRLGKPENQWTAEDIDQISIDLQLYPSEVYLTSETYSRDAERNANYDMQEFLVVNRKAKPEFTWEYLKADYVAKLMVELGYKYSIAAGGEEAPTIQVWYQDFANTRTINAYLGQTIEGTLIAIQSVKYWQNFRLAFPER